MSAESFEQSEAKYEAIRAGFSSRRTRFDAPDVAGNNNAIHAESRERVLLIHGLGGNTLCMLPIKWALDRLGYCCTTWSYSSFRGSIESHGANLRRFIQRELPGYDRVHFVGHSLGAIVVRSAFGSSPPSNLGRTVFLAPPNSGSPVAEIVSRITLGRFQTIADLSNRRESYVNQLPGWAGSELGIIAAKNDAVVPFGSTQLTNHSEHAIVWATHAGLLISRNVVRLTANFLKSGRFETGDT